MKAEILTLVLLMSLSTLLMAQQAENGPKKEFRGPQQKGYLFVANKGITAALNLADAQKESFKQGMMAMHKQLQPLRNELGEARAHQKTLVTAENPDLAAINSNIDKIGALRIEMAKIQMKNRLDMRAQLTDEQRLKFDHFKDKMKRGKGLMAMNQGCDGPHGHPDR